MREGRRDGVFRSCCDRCERTGGHSSDGMAHVRDVIGPMSAPSFNQNQGTLSWVLAGLLFGLGALVVRHDRLAVLVAVVFAVVGVVAGGSAGWISRDPSERAEH